MAKLKNITDITDVNQFFKDNSINRSEFFSNRKGFQTDVQNRIDGESASILQDQIAEVTKAYAGLGLQTSLYYDKPKNTIRLIAHPEEVKVDENGNIVGGTKKQTAQLKIELSDVGGTRGAGKRNDSYVVVTGKNKDGSMDRIMRAENAQIEMAIREIRIMQNKIKDAQGLQRAFNRATSDLNSVANAYDSEGRKDAAQDNKTLGQGRLDALIRSQQINHGTFLKDLQFAYHIMESDMGKLGQIFAILQSAQDMNKEIASIQNNSSYSKALKSQALLSRMANLIKTYNLRDNTNKATINEASISRTLGSFNLQKINPTPFETETSRNQYYRETKRKQAEIDGRKLFQASAFQSSAQMANALGFKRGQGAEAGERVASDAVVKMIGFRPDGKHVDDVVYIRSNAQKGLDSERDIRHRMSKDEYDKLFEEIKGKNENWKEDNINAAIVRRYISTLGRDEKNFDTDTFNVEQDGDEVILSAIEKMKMQTGTKILGQLAKGSAVISNEAFKGIDKDIFAATVLPSLDGKKMIRKGGQFVDILLNSTIQRYFGDENDSAHIGGGMDKIRNVAAEYGELGKAFMSSIADGDNLKEDIDWKDLTDLIDRGTANVTDLLQFLDHVTNGVDPIKEAVKTVREFKNSKHTWFKKDEDGKLIYNDSEEAAQFILYSALHQADEYPWSHGTDMSRPARSLYTSLAGARNMSNWKDDEYNEHKANVDAIVQSFQPKAENVQKLQRYQTSADENAKLMLYSGNPNLDGKVDYGKNAIKIGFGDGYDLDLSKVKREEYGEDGTVTNMEETLRGKLAKLIKNEDAKVVVVGDQIRKFGENYVKDAVFSAYDFMLDDNGKGYDTAAMEALSAAVNKKNNDPNANDMETFMTNAVTAATVGAHRDVYEETGTIYDDLMRGETSYTEGMKLVPMAMSLIESYAETGKVLVGKGKNKKENKVLTDFATTGMAVSEEKMRKFLDKRKDGSDEHLVTLQHLQKIADELKIEGVEKNAGREELINAILPYYDISGTKIKTLSDKQQDFILKNPLLGAIFGRAPYSHYLNANPGSVYVDSNLEGTLAVEAGLASTLSAGADFDGDVASLGLLSSKYYNTTGALKDAEKNIRGIAAWTKAKDIVKGSISKGLSEKDALLMVNKRLGRIAATEQRLQKTNTGAFANWRRNLADRMEERTRRGEDVSPEELVMSAMFEGIAQDAISSKKVINKILGAIKPGDITEEQIKTLQNADNNDGIASFEGGEADFAFNALSDAMQAVFSRNGNNFGQLMTVLADAGLINKDNRMVFEKGEIFQDAFLKLSQTKKGIEFLKKNGMWSNTFGTGSLTKEWLIDHKDAASAYSNILEQGFSVDTLRAAAKVMGNGDENKFIHSASIKETKAKIHAQDSDDVFSRFSSISEKSAEAMTESSVSLAAIVERLDVLIAKISGESPYGTYQKKGINILHGTPMHPKYNNADGKNFQSVTSALNVALPYLGKVSTWAWDNEGKINVSAQTGTAGHAIMEASIKHRGKKAFDNKKSKIIEDYKKQLEAAGIKGEEIENYVKNLEESSGGLIGYLGDPNKGNVKTRLAEIGISDSETGMYGIMDMLGQRKNADGTKTTVLGDYKFADHKLSQAELARYALQLAEYENMFNGYWTKMSDSFKAKGGGRWEDRNTPGVNVNKNEILEEFANDESVLKALSRSFKDKNGKSKKYEELDDKQKKSVDTSARKLAEQIWDTDQFQASLYQAFTNGAVQEFTLNMQKIPKDIFAKIQNGTQLTEDEYKAAASAMGITGYDGKNPMPPKPNQPKLLNAVGGDISKGFNYAFMGLMRGGITGKALTEFIKNLKQILAYTKQLDKAQTNLEIVTGSTNEQARSMMKTYSELAKTLGATTQEIAGVATEWLRQGYSAQSAEKLITSSVKLAKLGFMDQNQAVKALTSTMKGFNIEAENSSDIVDKLTTLDAKYATTAGDIATALSYVASVAKNAGMSLDETSAAITTIIDATQQDASSVGNALKTMVSRYGNVKAGAFSRMNAGEDTGEDGTINDVERVLKVLGINIRSTSSDMRDLSDVLDEISQKWSTMSDVEKNAVSNALAGTRQRNMFLSLMDNYDTYKQALKDEENSEGTSDIKMDKQLSHFEAAQKQLQASIEDLTLTLNQSGLLTGIYVFLSKVFDTAEYWFPAIVSLAQFFVTKWPDLLKGVQLPLIGALKNLTTAVNNNTAVRQGKDIEEPQKRDSKFSKFLQSDKAKKIGGAALSGITTGLTYGANGGGLAGNAIDSWTGASGYENEKTNAMTGVLTGIGAAIGSIYGPIGTMVGTLAGDFVSSAIKAIALSGEIAAGKIAESGKKEVEAINKVSKSAEKLTSLTDKVADGWNADDYAAADKAAADMITHLNATFVDGNGGVITFAEQFEKTLKDMNGTTIDATTAIRELGSGSADAAKYMSAYNATMMKQNAISTYRAAASDILELEKARDGAKDPETVKYYQDQINTYSRDYVRSFVEAAFLESGLKEQTTGELAGRTIETLGLEVAQIVENDLRNEKGRSGVDATVFDSNNAIASDVKSMIYSVLKSDNDVQNATKISTVTVSGLLKNKAFIDTLRKVGETDYELRRRAEQKEGFADSSQADAVIRFSQDKLQRFANALGVSVDDLEAIADDVEWLTEADLTSTVEEYMDKLKTAADIFSDIAQDGRLSMENVKKLTEKLPQLLGLSTSDIMGNIYNMLSGESSQIGWINKNYRQMIEDASFFENYIKANYYKNGNWDSLFSDDAKPNADQTNRLNGATNLHQIWDIISNDKTAGGALSKVTATIGSLIPALDMYKDIENSIIDASDRIYDDQINKLNDLKSSLDDINKQRDREINLIKAQKDLENAQKEKKRVYRAGIGFTYEADQQAIADAQEKLDELEREKDKDNIQYQIDQLEQQKQLLSDIRDETDIDAQRKMLEGLLGNDGEKSVVSLLSELVNAMNNVDTTVSEAAENIGTQDQDELDTMVENYNSALESIETAKSKLQNSTVANYEQNREAFNAAVNNASTQYQNIVSFAKANGLTTDAKAPNSSEVENTESNYISNTGMHPVNYKNYKMSNSGGDIAYYKKITTDDGNSFLVESDQKDYDYKYIGQKNSGGSWYDQNGKSVTGVANGLEVYGNNAGDYGHKSFRSVREWYDANKNNGNSLYWQEVLNSRGTGYVARALTSEEVDKLERQRQNNSMYRWNGETQQIEYFAGSDGWKYLDNGWSRFWQLERDFETYATGTTSAPGGTSLINELGLEGIVTPDGTITSLPAKSGIIPADLTKNLWQLGEVAPNLIAKLGIGNLSGSPMANNTDNSTNIDNLNATFYTTDNFDGDEFLRDLRSQISLTKNNH